jgi:hypothetical protein
VQCRHHRHDALAGVGLHARNTDPPSGQIDVAGTVEPAEFADARARQYERGYQRETGDMATTFVLPDLSPANAPDQRLAYAEVAAYVCRGPLIGADRSDLTSSICTTSRNERLGVRGRRKQSESSSGLWSISLRRLASLRTLRTPASVLLMDELERPRRRRWYVLSLARS